jgi:hypothetical protein
MSGIRDLKIAKQPATHNLRRADPSLTFRIMLAGENVKLDMSL